MNTTKKIAVRRDAFTLVEMLVVIAIILALAALAAAFAPRVNDNQKLSRAVDNLEQWLLTAKMRAKRDGLATGLRFIQAPGDAAGTYSQFQYIQQPEPLTGGFTSANLLGPNLVSAGAGMVTFANVDFSLGGLPPLDTFGRQQWLVQTGDYLEINGGGVYSIWGVVVPAPGQPANQLVLGGSLSQSIYFSSAWVPPLPPMTVVNVGGLTIFPPAQLWQSAYEQGLTIAEATTNYRILRQPRILIGEEPLALPDNYAANFNVIPGTTTLGCNVLPGASGYFDIVFSPTGAVVGTNAGTPILYISVWDTTMELPDYNRVGIVGIQSRSGFIGAYGVAGPVSPLLFVQTARESGL
jgi:prepilin-type N-terminal cleavage/methylation domain-containing protein